MPYPVTGNASVQPAGTLQLKFRPATAGLVNVTLVGFGIPPIATPPAPHLVPPSSYTIKLHFELFKPGVTTPIAATDVLQRVVPPLSNRVVAFVNAPAGASDLGGDWIARVTNRGLGAVTCRLTGRYQVVPGNLGKIDHVVVLMMENRSFDHMLGYLKLEGKRPEIEGLTGAEVNHDANGVAVAVHPLATDGRSRPTFFANDPGHGWNDVVDQLLPDAFTGISNGGFVKNFTKQLADQAKDLPPVHTTIHDVGLIDSEDSRSISFRPVLAGKVTMYTTLSARGQKSTNGMLAELLLFRPGQSKAVATAIVPFGPNAQTSFGLTHDVTADELAVPGNWTCVVANWVTQAITFTTDVSFISAEHDTSGQEPPAAIMGYYDATQLPVYDVLASEFTVCDHWFASLPTDTWPNRLYALAGGSEGIRDTPSGKDVPKHPPGYTLPSIFELLQKRQIDWKIFYSDFPFPLVFKTIAQNAEYTARMAPFSNFLAAAQTGDLPSVSWLEPRFSDVEQAITRDAAQDDHPPGDVTRGQQLVQQVYDAISRGPAWSKTLLLITYDEHGGFFDHFPPPAQPNDDLDSMKFYGLRVPAFVVSPWVPRRSVAKDTFDHTSLLATILRRFCAGAVPSMGKRTDHALDVGPLLSAPQVRSAVPKIVPVVAPPVNGGAAAAPDSFGLVLRKLLIGF